MDDNNMIMRHYEEQEARFKAVTGLGIDAFIKFYTAHARLPNDKEIELINFYGIEKYLDLVVRFRTIKLPPAETLYSDLENLGMAKVSFIQACKLSLKKLFSRNN